MKVKVTSAAKDQLLQIAGASSKGQHEVARIFAMLKALEESRDRESATSPETGKMKKVTSQEDMNVWEVKSGDLRAWLSIPEKDPTHAVIFRVELAGREEKVHP